MIPALKNVNKTLPALCSGPVYNINLNEWDAKAKRELQPYKHK